MSRKSIGCGGVRIPLSRQKRRNSNWTDSTTVTGTTTKRGYTGHEHLDPATLVHMNGRVYDPSMARMLSPDPVVQNPADSQNFNRYAYARNSSLTHSDPSGYMTAYGGHGFAPFVGGLGGSMGGQMLGGGGASAGYATVTMFQYMMTVAHGRPIGAISFPSILSGPGSVRSCISDSGGCNRGWQLNQNDGGYDLSHGEYPGVLIGFGFPYVSTTVETVIVSIPGDFEYTAAVPPEYGPSTAVGADGQGFLSRLWGRTGGVVLGASRAEGQQGHPNRGVAYGTKSAAHPGDDNSWGPPIKDGAFLRGAVTDPSTQAFRIVYRADGDAVWRAASGWGSTVTVEDVYEPNELSETSIPLFILRRLGGRLSPVPIGEMLVGPRTRTTWELQEEWVRWKQFDVRDGVETYTGAPIVARRTGRYFYLPRQTEQIGAGVRYLPETRLFKRDPIFH